MVGTALTRLCPPYDIASGQMLLPRSDPLPDRLRYRDRTMGFLIGVDPDDFTGHERLVAALQEDREFEGEARVADPRHARTDVQFPVEVDFPYRQPNVQVP